MKRFLICTLLVLNCFELRAQQVDKDLLTIKQKMDAIQEFTARLELNIDVPFIKMPSKRAEMHYKKGENIDFSSSDFVFLPKRGLDFSLSEIFKYSFITVDRGTEVRSGKTLKVLNVIPTDERSSLALATLFLNVESMRIAISEITTKKQGTYTVQADYANAKAVLPNFMKVTFAIERLKIPLNFMGSDTQIDRKKMRNMDTKTGTIHIKINYLNIVND